MKKLRQRFRCSFLAGEEILNAIDDVERNPRYKCEGALAKNIFKPFGLIDHSPRLIIMGQDPYPNGLATGIPFEVKKGRNAVAMRNICKSLGLKGEWFDIASWAKQNDVLLLNASLSYSSHLSQYCVWRPFWNVVLPRLFIDSSVMALALGRKAHNVIKQQEKERFLSARHPCARVAADDPLRMNPSKWKELLRSCGISYPHS